jgi:hypothetical protein
MWHGQEPLRSSFKVLGHWALATGRLCRYTPATGLLLQSALCVRSMRQSRVPLRSRTLGGPGVWLCSGECGKGTLPSDHLTENKPIRLAAPCVRRPRRSKNEGLRCGLYESIDHIEGLIELRAEHVHNELEVQLERN